MSISGKKKKWSDFITGYGIPFLVACWAVVQICLYKSTGVYTEGESTKVIGEATNLFQGKGLSAPGYALYLTEIFLVYLKLKAGFGYGPIIILQMIVNLVALLVFFRFLIFFYESKLIALAGAMLLLICFPYQIYNTFLYTESLFFSGSVLYSCWLLKQKNFNLKKIITIIFFLLLLCITRPTGIFFAAATFIYLLFAVSGSLSPLFKAAIFVCASVLTLLLLNNIISGGGTLDMMLPFRKEMIICDVPTANAAINTNGDDNSLQGVLYYLTHNFPQFSRMAVWKTKSFFGLTRGYYSTGHNLFIASFFYSLYALILITVLKFRKRSPAAFIYIAMLVTAFWLSVLLSCDEWHSRIFLTLTPFLIMVALYFFRKKSKGAGAGAKPAFIPPVGF